MGENDRKPEQVIRASRFELVGPSGNVRAVFGEEGGAAGMFVYDKYGRRRLNFHLDEESGMVCMEMVDSAGRPRARIVADAEISFVGVYDSEGKMSYVIPPDESPGSELAWTPDLSSGVQVIDMQHKELFRRINAILDSIRRREVTAAEIDELVQFLGRYAKTHFGTEEVYMMRYDYPRYVSHKVEHQEFSDVLEDLRKELAEEGVTLKLLDNVRRDVCMWLVNHIRKTDVAMGRFLDEAFHGKEKI